MTDRTSSIEGYFPERAPDDADLYRMIFAYPELAVYVLRIDRDGEIAFHDANDGVVRLAGRPLSEILGKSPVDCLPAPISECLLGNLRKCLDTGNSMTYARTLELPEGRMAWKTSLLPLSRPYGKTRYVLGLSRDITHEKQLSDTAHHNAALLRSLGIALPSAVYLLNLETKTIRFLGGDLDETRRQWRKQAEDAGGLAAHRFFHPDDHAKSSAHYAELKKLRDGEISTIDYRILSADGQYRPFANRETVFSRNEDGEVELVLGISEDVSERDRMRQEVDDLSERMLTLQIDERRRIAVELHDSTGQHLTAAGLALTVARASNPDNGDADERQKRLSDAIDDAVYSLREAQREIQVLSYLLHPPQILSQGLGEAITGFAAGFGRRAGLKIDVDMAPSAHTIGDDVALQLFRVCQEALTNIYRHAEANRASVELAIDERTISLTVTDDGIGFEDTAVRAERIGVGLAGMRDRIHRLGGSLGISTEGRGTRLVATVPKSAA